ncbi:MAG: cysteine--tRNA ligase [Rhodospirillales bacterium]|nr:cysteine--tRNA ligase [Rhodospirillales bacterium]
MALKIYDTLRRDKVTFEPRDPKHVRMYVCGPTVYDYAHIGNARPVVVFDVLYRLLKHIYEPQGAKITYVRNITDVDDKIIAASKETGEPIDAITRRTTDAFHADMKALGVLEPDAEPKATEHIAEMIALVKELLAKGHAYEAPGDAKGHVLFSVSSMADYGRLSRLDREALVAGARVEVAPYKKDPADFVLWKPSTPEQPGWKSPWGRGRPGWHIECSAMSEKFLGKSFDIHGGGQDLIFPHHENEIAQSTCVRGKDAFAKYWMHNGYLMAEGEKMSKSLGNFYTVHDLLREFPGEVIRFLLLKTHYRQPLDFTKRGLVSARAELDRFYTAVRIAKQNAEPCDVDPPEEIVIELGDDLDTPMAIRRLHDIASDLNNATAPETKIDRKRVAELAGKLVAGGRLLGLIQQDPEEWRRWKPEGIDGLTNAEIESLIERRAAARKAKDFKRADHIRDELLKKGIVLEDSAGNTTWRRQ